MIVTMEPWLFHLLLSIIVLILTFIIGSSLHNILKRKEKTNKGLERWMAVGLAALMGAFYFYITDVFTDRASYGERVINADGVETIESEQEVVVPFGTYVVIERLYEFGYVVRDTVKGEDYQIIFQIEDEPDFLKEYSSYITGDGVLSNDARFDFNQAYEEEWKQAVKEVEHPDQAAFPGVKVEVETKE